MDSRWIYEQIRIARESLAFLKAREVQPVK